MIELFAEAIAAAFLIATGVTAVFVRLGGQLGLTDVPNARSSHSTPTPRGGGFGVAAGVAGGALVFLAAGKGPGRAMVVVLVAAGAVAIVGALDDLFPLPAWSRLAAQLLTAIAVVIALGPVDRLPLPVPLDVPLGWLAGPLTVLWLAGVTNFFNFMDGIDGLAGGQTIASCLGIFIAAWSRGAEQLATILIAATAGFLVFNRPPAKIFLGDVGSTSIGFAIAAMPLLAPTTGRSSAAFAVGVGLSLFLLDPLATLIRIARAGLGIGIAHRLHAYQQLAIVYGQPAVTVALVLGGAALCIMGGLAYRIAFIAWPTVALGLCLFVMEEFLAARSDTLVDGA